VERSLMCLEHNHDQREDDEDSSVEERNACRRAFHCRTMLTDDRVLANLLATEHHNRPAADCLCRLTDVLPYMRDVVVTWMLEVSTHCTQQLLRTVDSTQLVCVHLSCVMDDG